MTTINWKTKVKALVAATFFGLLFYFSGVIQPLENWLQAEVASMLVHPVESDITIVEIDARSIEIIGQWPWPRSLHAVAIERIGSHSPESVFLDIDFSANSDKDEDARLWDSLNKFSRQNTLFLPAFLQKSSLTRNKLLLRYPEDALSTKAKPVSVNLRPEADGMVRSADSGFSFEGKKYPVAGSTIASNIAKPTAIDYSIHPASFEYISFVDLLNENFNPALITDRKVIVGATAIELGDNVAVPIYGSLPGAVVQALIAATHQQGGLQQPELEALQLGLMPLLIALCFLLTRFNWEKGMVVMSFLVLSSIVISIFSYQVLRIVLPMVFPAVFLIVGYFMVLISQLDFNVLEKLQLKLRLRDSDAMLDTLLISSSDCIICINDKEIITHASVAGRKLLEREKEHLIGEDIRSIVPGIEYDQRKGTSSTLDTTLKTGNGKTVPVELSVSSITLAQETSYLLVVRDLRKRIRRENELRYQALHDDLTGLPNRAYLFEEFERAFAEGTRHSLFMLDLSLFKEVNDHYGHQMGDEILRCVGHRLGITVEEYAICFRLGGDEFAIWFDQALEAEACESAALNIINSIGKPFNVEESQIEIGACIGITNFDPEIMDATTALRQADLALYEAKRSSISFAWYRKELDEKSIKNIHLVPLLRNAIDEDKLGLVFQPKIILDSNMVTGSEVLLRWTKDDGEYVPPNIFIDVAENSRLIAPLTIWVIRSLLDREAEWQANGLPRHVAVNLSARLLDNSGFLHQMQNLLQTSNGYFGIEFEVTETALMSNKERAILTINQLRGAGYKISIDDYGTGYSSLSYLRDLGASTLKIDKIFIDDLDTNTENQIIVRSTIKMASELGLKIVAEGVESLEQREMLEDLGCNIGQGYLFGRPMNEVKFRSWFSLWEKQRQKVNIENDQLRRKAM